MRARAASNSASLTRKAKCRWLKSVESEKSSVTPLPVLTGTKWPHSGPASRFRMSARNLAEAHLSFAGMIVWFNSTVISALLFKASYHILPHSAGKPRQVTGRVPEHVLDAHATAEIMADRIFLGHADAAVQLDRVLRDKAARLADPDFGHRDVVCPLRRIGFVDRHRRQHRHAAALLE